MEQKTQGKVFVIGGAIGLMVSIYFLVNAIRPTQNIPEQLPTEQENVQEGTNPEKTSIQVLIPAFLLTTGFQTIANTIAQEQGISVTFHTPTQHTIYQTIEQDREYNGQTMDVMMIPSDLLLSFAPQSTHIQMTEDLTSYYDQSFSGILEDQTYTFVPHSIDPIVVYTKNDTIDLQSIDTRTDIITQWNPTQRGHFPILFGRSAQDIQFWKQGRETVEESLFILYNIINHTITTSDPNNTIQSLLSLQKNTKNQGWNLAEFVNTTNKYNQQNNKCKTYPSICGLQYDFGDSRLGLLSDIWTIEQYFNIPQYTIQSLWMTNDYPARGWGFVVNSTSTGQRQAIQFLESYIQASLISIDKQLRSSTIPASTIAQAQTVRTQRSEKNRSIGWETMIYQSDYRQKIIELLQGTISPEEFKTILKPTLPS